MNIETTAPIADGAGAIRGVHKNRSGPVEIAEPRRAVFHRLGELQWVKVTGRERGKSGSVLVLKFTDFSQLPSWLLALETEDPDPTQVYRTHKYSLLIENPRRVIKPL
ncbi:hypothetical protein [Kitasatospora sp. NPDC002040]|uniref:hypothetical protein n=1 Tax=Kitasatospora sp. NPDC002040 TaxID=3154661 RepID=UPI003324CF72